VRRRDHVSYLATWSIWKSRSRTVFWCGDALSELGAQPPSRARPRPGPLLGPAAGPAMTPNSATCPGQYLPTLLWCTRVLCFSQKLDPDASASVAKSLLHWLRARFMVPKRIVCKVGRMLICCTGAGTRNFQIDSERVQYRLKWHVLDHIRSPSTLQNFQCSLETIFAF